MKKLVAVLSLAAAFALVPGSARADAEGKMLGTVTKITLAKDGNSAVATLRDGKSGQTVDIAVEDKITLDKFKDHRISAGDEIKAKYTENGGKHLATFFKKPGGC